MIPRKGAAERAFFDNLLESGRSAQSTKHPLEQGERNARLDLASHLPKSRASRVTDTRDAVLQFPVKRKPLAEPGVQDCLKAEEGAGWVHGLIQSTLISTTHLDSLGVTVRLNVIDGGLSIDNDRVVVSFSVDKAKNSIITSQVANKMLIGFTVRAGRDKRTASPTTDTG